MSCSCEPTSEQDPALGCQATAAAAPRLLACTHLPFSWPYPPLACIRLPSPASVQAPAGQRGRAAAAQVLRLVRVRLRQVLAQVLRLAGARAEALRCRRRCRCFARALLLRSAAPARRRQVLRPRGGCGAGLAAACSRGGRVACMLGMTCSCREYAARFVSLQRPSSVLSLRWISSTVGCYTRCITTASEWVRSGGVLACVNLAGRQGGRCKGK